MQIILDSLKTEKDTEVWYYIKILTITGLRSEELLSMKKDQVFDDHILIHGKGSRDRIFPYFIFHELRTYIMEIYKLSNDENLFHRTYNHMLKKYKAVQRKNLKLDESEISGFHKIRKSVATIWKEMGMPLEDRCSLIGHDVDIENKIYNRTPDVEMYKKRMGDLVQIMHNKNNDAVTH